MLLLIVIIAAAVAAAVLLSRGNSGALTDEYCKLECKERKIQDYSICC